MQSIETTKKTNLYETDYILWIFVLIVLKI